MPREDVTAVNVAMLAPPWIPIPPPKYGGIEHVVALLCDGLIDLGHRVTLFAAPGSRSSATVREVLPQTHPDEIGESLYEADHVSRVLRAVAEAAAAADWPFQPNKQDYLLWMGRFDDYKGAHRAIAVARKAGDPLLLAGPVQPGQEAYFSEQIEPHLDGDQVRYLDEVGGAEKEELLANARCLLMPITWNEPFGMVMVEALACGTPVIAFPQGAAREIVQHELNGFLVDDEESMSAALADLDRIDPATCRESVATRFSPDTVADGYLTIYAKALGGQPVVADYSPRESGHD